MPVGCRFHSRKMGDSFQQLALEMACGLARVSCLAELSEQGYAPGQGLW